MLCKLVKSFGLDDSNVEQQNKPKKVLKILVHQSVTEEDPMKESII